MKTQVTVQNNCWPLIHFGLWASLIAQLVKNLPAMQETPVQFLGWEDRIGYLLQYSSATLVAQLVKNPPECRRPGFDPWVGKIPWRRERLPTPVFWPGEFHGLCSPCGCKKSDMTKLLSLTHLLHFDIYKESPFLESNIRTRVG